MRGRFVAATAMALLLVSCGSGRDRAPDGAKNVIVVTFDGLRQDHLSAFGYPRLTSPNLDWLVEHGIAFRNIVPTSCSTKASLTSLYTGLGYEDHGLIEHNARLSEDHLTLAEAFYDAGWQTEAFVATAHLMAESGYDQGFEIYQDFHGRGEKTYISADQVIGEVLGSLAERSDSPERPFFYYIHIEEPHPPWRGESPWLLAGSEIEQPFDEGCTWIPSPERRAAVTAIEREEMLALYDGAIRYADTWIGALLGALRARGELRNTIVAVSTDHGYELLERYSVTHGMNPFDEVTRTFLVLFDGADRLAATPHTERQGRIFDIGPTVMRRAGIDIPETFQGVDLLGDEEPPPFAFSECYVGRLVRGEGYKLVQWDYSLERWRKERTRPPFEEGLALYDLREDPAENVDVSASRPAQLERMAAALGDYARRIPGGVEAVDRDDIEGLSDEAIERLRALGYVE